MIKRSVIFLINLICILSFIFFEIKYENIKNNKLLFLIILVILILINIIIIFLKKCVDKLDSYLNCEIRNYEKINIELKRPKCKSSNDELMKLISEYNKNNTFGDKK